MKIFQRCEMISEGAGANEVEPALEQFSPLESLIRKARWNQ
jgi:hypothetical protein